MTTNLFGRCSRLFLAAVVLALVTTGCGSGSAPTPATSTAAGTAPGTASTTPGTASPGSAGPAVKSTYSKVLLIVEENKSYAEAMGQPGAPYLTSLSRQYGLATQMQAGYPPGCPSLAAYILMTSGSTHGICDDRNPSAHPLTGASIFSQVAASGREWRSYAEAMPGNCELTNSGDGLFLVRHVPSTYYLDQRAKCGDWTVPLGTADSGALHDDLAAGKLPAFGMITPDACNDMHGASGCGKQLPTGDAWLKAWMPKILAAPDYRAGHLAVIVTWDEGTHFDNHIPTMVISPTTTAISSGTRWTHCSTLRTTEEILGLPLLGCASTAPSMRQAFHL